MLDEGVYASRAALARGEGVSRAAVTRGLLRLSERLAPAEGRQRWAGWASPRHRRAPWRPRASLPRDRAGRPRAPARNPPPVRRSCGPGPACEPRAPDGLPAGGGHGAAGRRARWHRLSMPLRQTPPMMR